MSDRARLTAALETARKELLAARTATGHWVGCLSSSALSTATAVCALSLVEKSSVCSGPGFESLVASGLDWLASHANADGGWGDTVLSHSNLSTTTLCWAAFGVVAGGDAKYCAVVAAAASWLHKHAGGVDAGHLVPAVIKRYGEDRTFSAPILTMCALAGRLGQGRGAWSGVLSLPFELAACPHEWFAALRLPVVSYALPALIAIGQARHYHRPTRNPVLRVARNLARRRTLAVLADIQPASGGFLEAIPLTSFVVMSLAGSGQGTHPVTIKGAEFLGASARADGSWPIDTNLSTWLTTLAVNALCQFPEGGSERLAVLDWLLGQQFKGEHPYTHAAPGGWAWTDLPGGVPDADDTAGALMAVHRLGESGTKAVHNAAMEGVHWLLDIQNRDGGIPTFCRGWGKLPFDRSAPDLTAHALRAWSVWFGTAPEVMQGRIRQAVLLAVRYLKKSQRGDGSWVPLWFGNQDAPNEENPTYGTSRVLLGLQELAARELAEVSELLVKGGEWLVAAQNADGGWGGFPRSRSSVEETAWAVEALAGFFTRQRGQLALDWRRVEAALERGAVWLAEKVESGDWKRPSPIGFYFARLWYYEELYPMIFTVGALGRAVEACEIRGRDALG